MKTTFKGLALITFFIFTVGAISKVNQEATFIGLVAVFYSAFMLGDSKN